jgi:subtilisin family serine protease
MKRFAHLSIVVVFVLALFALARPAQTLAGGEVRVMVEFAPGRGAAVRGALQRAGGTIHHDLDSINAIAVSLPAAALEGIQRNPNVLSVEEDLPRYAMSQTTPWGIDSVQALEVWDADNDGVVDVGAPTGEGITVCIIDSGLHTGHEDFAGVNILGGYPSDWNVDLFGHGTHVAGTIAAANNDLGVVGVTPGGVSLFIVKVFGDDGLWAYSSDLIDAASHCADAGANIISMSLGGDGRNRLERLGFDALYDQGILSIAAAGNDANTRKSYPASYDSVVSVAAIDSDYLIADFSQQNDQVELAAPGVHVLSTVPYLATDELTVGGETYTGNHIEFAPTGEVSGLLVDGGLCAPGTVADWTGAVVLCQRGDFSFYEKVTTVEDNGGAAAVIYNNEPGNFLGTLGEGNTSNIIAISLSQEDGQFLVANELGSIGDIYSHLSIPDSGYEAWDGTSMATPHVSGVAALLWSSRSGLTNEDIREAMNMTALDLGLEGRDNAYGYGLVQAYDALQYLDGGTPSEVHMHVAAMDMWYGRRGANYLVYTEVTMVNDDGETVADATVELAITLPDGSIVTASGVTGADGVAVVQVKSKQTGTYISEVTGVTHDLFNYQPGLNVVTSASIDVP